MVGRFGSPLLTTDPDLADPGGTGGNPKQQNALGANQASGTDAVGGAVGVKTTSKGDERDRSDDRDDEKKNPLDRDSRSREGGDRGGERSGGERQHEEGAGDEDLRTGKSTGDEQPDPPPGVRVVHTANVPNALATGPGLASRR